MQLSDNLKNVFRNVADKTSEAVAVLATAAPVAAAAYIAHKTGIGNGGLALATSALYALASYACAEGIRQNDPLTTMFAPLAPGMVAAVPTAFMLSRVGQSNDPNMISATATAIAGALMVPPAWHLRNALRLDR